MTPESEMLALIKRHHGNHAAMARALGITATAMRWRVQQLGIAYMRAAAAERAMHGVDGPRFKLTRRFKEAEKAKLIRLLAKRGDKTYADVADDLGMSRRALFRRLSEYGINTETLARRRS